MPAPLPAPADPTAGKTLLGVVPRAALESRLVTALPTPVVGGGTSPHVPAAPAVGNAPSAVATRASKLVVSTYRLLGFGILSLIVVVLIGYIATTAFFYLSHSWVVPTVVSGSDAKVIGLQTELATHQNQRDKLAGELADADRAVVAEQTFQTEFARAIQSDLAGRQAALGRVQKLAAAAAATRSEIRRSNESYARASANRIASDYGAGLIDQHALLAGKYQLAQISTSSLSVAERQAALEEQEAELASATQGLDALLSDHASDGGLTYDVLKIKRDYDTSKLALAHALDERKSVAAALAREDEIVKGLQQSAYLRAIADHAMVAVVPYDNVSKMAAGDKLYACRVGMVICHEVGTVLEILPGEVTFKHPHKDSDLRGKMIEMRIDDPGAAEHDVLFAGGAPLWL